MAAARPPVKKSIDLDESSAKLEEVVSKYRETMLLQTGNPALANPPGNYNESFLKRDLEQGMTNIADANSNATVKQSIQEIQNLLGAHLNQEHQNLMSGKSFDSNKWNSGFNDAAIKTEVAKIKTEDPEAGQKVEAVMAKVRLESANNEMERLRRSISQQETNNRQAFYAEQMWGSGYEKKLWVRVDNYNGDPPDPNNGIAGAAQSKTYKIGDTGYYQRLDSKYILHIDENGGITSNYTGGIFGYNFGKDVGERMELAAARNIANGQPDKPVVFDFPGVKEFTNEHYKNMSTTIAVARAQLHSGKQPVYDLEFGAEARGLLLGSNQYQSSKDNLLADLDKYRKEYAEYRKANPTIDEKQQAERDKKAAETPTSDGTTATAAKAGADSTASSKPTADVSLSDGGMPAPSAPLLEGGIENDSSAPVPLGTPSTTPPDSPRESVVGGIGQDQPPSYTSASETKQSDFRHGSVSRAEDEVELTEMQKHPDVLRDEPSKVEEKESAAPVSEHKEVDSKELSTAAPEEKHRAEVTRKVEIGQKVTREIEEEKEKVQSADTNAAVLEHKEVDQKESSTAAPEEKHHAEVTREDVESDHSLDEEEVKLEENHDASNSFDVESEEEEKEAVDADMVELNEDENENEEQSENEHEYRRPSPGGRS